MLAWFIVRMIKCDPEWACFGEEWGKAKLTCPEWAGEKRGLLASYQWAHVEGNIWPKFAELMPVDELKEYSPHWVSRKGKQKKKLNVKSGLPSIELYQSGGQVDFGAYQQGQVARESFTYDVVGSDEQMPEGQFIAIKKRGLTKWDEGFQIAVAATPHRVDGQPETGSGTWLHKMVQGLNYQGMEPKEVCIYHIKTEEVPDEILSKSAKESERRELHEALESKNQARISAAKSRYYGTFESSEGLVYDNWNPSLHWIDPFPIPADWSRYRAVDPGRVHPFAVGWLAVAPWGDMVWYREYYEAGLGMAENVRNVIEVSGNERVKVSELRNVDGDVSGVFEERFTSEQYIESVMDSRTFAQPSQETTTTQGDIYREMGLDCVPASGMKNRDAVPLVKRWLEPITGRSHILVKMKLMDEIINPDTGKPITAAPKLYVFNTCPMFHSEIEGYVNKPDSEDPVDKDDHLMTALKYMCLANPSYQGQLINYTPESAQYDRKPANPYTGYVRP